MGKHFSAEGDPPSREERQRRNILQDDDEYWAARERIGNFEPIETKVFPTDLEFLSDPGLQQTYDILAVARKFLKAKYPHITHIAGWKVPE